MIGPSGTSSPMFLLQCLHRLPCHASFNQHCIDHAFSHPISEYKNRVSKESDTTTYTAQVVLTISYYLVIFFCSFCTCSPILKVSLHVYLFKAPLLYNTCIFRLSNHMPNYIHKCRLPITFLSHNHQPIIFLYYTSLVLLT